MIKDRAVIRDNLLKLVTENPELIKNRNSLIANYWVNCDNATSLFRVSECTPAESITREFRNLVTMGLVVLEVDVKEALTEKQSEYFEEALKC